MKTFFATIAFSLILASVASAQPAPAGAAPILKIVDKVDSAKGLITFRQTVYKTIPVLKEIIVNINGQRVKQAVTEYVTEAVEETVQIDVAKSRVITPDGKQLPIDEVWKRVKAKTVVAVSADGNTPAAAFLRTLHADTVILIPNVPAPPKLPAPK